MTALLEADALPKPIFINGTTEVVPLPKPRALP